MIDDIHPPQLLPWKRGETLLRLDQVVRMVGFQKSEIYRRIAEGNFPPSIALTKQMRGWFESEVDAWINVYKLFSDPLEVRQEQRRLVAAIRRTSASGYISPGAISPRPISPGPVTQAPAAQTEKLNAAPPGESATASKRSELPAEKTASSPRSPGGAAKAKTAPVRYKAAPALASGNSDRHALSTATRGRVTPRKVAAAAGASFYNGKACLNGHEGGRRYVSTGACVACVENKDASRRHHPSRPISPGPISPGPISPRGAGRFPKVDCDQENDWIANFIIATCFI